MRRLVVVRAKECIAGGPDGWGWKGLRAFSARWFDSLASVQRLVESEEVWPEKFS